MFHLFGRTYLDHEVFYNTKYDSVILSAIEKPHPISEKIGTSFGNVPSFKNFLEQNYSSSIESFWDKSLKEAGQKQILFADSDCYHNLLIQFWKSLLKDPTVDSVFELYTFHIFDNDLKLVMNIDRADNFKKLRPGELPIVDYDVFKSIYEKEAIIDCLHYHHKEDVSFEYLMMEYFLDSTSRFLSIFLQRLRLLCWRTWLSDVYSLRNEYLGGYLKIDADPSVGASLRKNKLTSWMLDKNFNEKNIEYIRNHYSADIFISLNNTINPDYPSSPGNVWESFNQISEALFRGDYLKLLEEDIVIGRSCTLIRDHLANEANHVFASKIYEHVRNGKIELLNKFKLA